MKVYLSECRVSNVPRSITPDPAKTSTKKPTFKIKGLQKIHALTHDKIIVGIK